MYRAHIYAFSLRGRLWLYRGVLVCIVLPREHLSGGEISSNLGRKGKLLNVKRDFLVAKFFFFQVVLRWHGAGHGEGDIVVVFLVLWCCTLCCKVTAMRNDETE